MQGICVPLQEGLERSDAVLSASDTLWRERITKLPFCSGALLAGLTGKGRQAASALSYLS